MKQGKKILSVLLAVLLLASCLPMAAWAAEETPYTAREIAQAYKKIITSSSFPRYTKPVLFSNVCGDTMPEMIVMVSDGALTEMQVWTYLNGSAKKVISTDWTPFSDRKNALYKLGDGRLGTYSTNTVYDGSSNYSTDYNSGSFYQANSSGGFTKSGSFSYQYYRYNNGATKFEGKLNDSPASESAVRAEEKKMKAGTMIFDYHGTAKGIMSAYEAETYLNGITGAFFDVASGQYYTEPVAWAVENGITSGTSIGYFSPNQGCTRAQAMTFLWKAMGSPIVEATSTFSDVSRNAYYYNAVNWAVANGITSGTGGGKFSPEQKCTRAQIVTFLWKAAGSPSVGGSTFSDIPVNAYYKTAVSWAVANGITSGTGNGKFSPEQNCTRGQIVTFLYKVRNFQFDPKPVSGWNEAYQDFVMNQRFLTTAQEYSMEAGFFTYGLYDMDQDGTPELTISNGRIGRAVRYDYLYTYHDGSVIYLDVGPSEAYYNPKDKNGLFGRYSDMGEEHWMKYGKLDLEITRFSKGVYPNGTGQKDYIILPIISSTSLPATGWAEFVASQPI